LRVAGISIDQIAREFGCTPAAINACLDRMVGGIDSGYRSRALLIELERLDENSARLSRHDARGQKPRCRIDFVEGSRKKMPVVRPLRASKLCGRNGEQERQVRGTGWIGKA
jgi:hypothetical protein